MEKKCKQYNQTEINAIEMELDCAELVVLEALDSTQIAVEAEIQDGDFYKNYVDNGVLYINYQLKKQKNFFNRGKNENMRITLWIPKGKNFANVTLEVGAGNADMTAVALSCDVMELEVGAGDVHMETIRINNRLDVEVGAGKVKAARMDVKELNVECGVGKCEMGLSGKESDYNYSISCGIGKIKINGSEVRQIGASESKRHAEAIGTVNLSCGVGKIILHTAV